jgi:hypothetical protein
VSASAQPPDILRTVIVGEEFAATLVAAALAENQDLKQRPVQVLVLPPAVGDPVWQADAALPWHGLPRIRKLLDADSAVAAGGAFSWGIALTGWAGTGHSGFLPFGSVGAPFGPIGFQHIVQRLRQGGARPRRPAGSSALATTPDPCSVLPTTACTWICPGRQHDCASVPSRAACGSASAPKSRRNAMGRDAARR